MEFDRIATAPEHENKGVASLLVKSGLEQADAAGANVLVMAFTISGQKLYEKCFRGSSTGSVNHCMFGESLARQLKPLTSSTNNS